jgi:hypothetical protein
LVKVSRSEAKSDDRDKPVEAKMQSKTAGTAAGGTWLKLVESVLIRVAMESVSSVDIWWPNIADRELRPLF